MSRNWNIAQPGEAACLQRQTQPSPGRQTLQSRDTASRTGHARGGFAGDGASAQCGPPAGTVSRPGPGTAPRQLASSLLARERRPSTLPCARLALPAPPAARRATPACLLVTTDPSLSLPRCDPSPELSPGGTFLFRRRHVLSGLQCVDDSVKVVGELCRLGATGRVVPAYLSVFISVTLSEREIVF